VRRCPESLLATELSVGRGERALKIGAVRSTLRRFTDDESVEGIAGQMTDPRGNHGPVREDLAEVIAEVARLLPAQGPITVFIHHNTLHAFEEKPFEDAVVRAGRLLGCEPFLAEARYRAELAEGRIGAEDIRGVLGTDLGERAAERIAGVVTRFDLRERILRYGIPLAEGRAIAWLIRETDVLERFRSDLPVDAREKLGTADERRAVRDLWAAAVCAARTLPGRAPEKEEPRRRHRDSILLAGGGDSDEWVHPLLIRFVGTFLDQGLAYWPMPHREEGLFRCFLRLHGRLHACPPDPSLRLLSRLARADEEGGRSAEASIEHSLDVLGVPRGEWRAFLTECVLPVRGWAGMVRQLEERPDRAPVRAPPATLADLLAVRLLADRAAIEDLAREWLGYHGPLRELRAHFGRAAPRTASTDVLDRAWELFHLAQLCGVDAARFERLSPAEVAELGAELAAFDEVERRRLLQLAYEHRLRRGFYDAVANRPVRAESEAPRFQAIFCIDEREESIRRHLEEMAPSAETLGAAGYFGVAMLYKGAEDAHPRPLCPVAIRPAHRVEEVLGETEAKRDEARAGLRRLLGRARRNLLLGSHTLVRGTLVMTVLGTVAVIPLVLRVLWPRLLPRLARLRAALVVREPTRLLLDEVASPPGTGFNKQEMADIVRRLLEDVGVAHRLAPLLLIVGHGSTSLNNPHESAHDCGACGGGRGGPNARAFAQMANDPEVRRLLEAQGLRVPPETWFVGAEHNSCNDDVEYFDTDLIPAAARPSFEGARGALRRACRRNAHERCRRFESAPAWYSSSLALAHVQARAADLAEPRPEFGHATNSYCLIGRRVRTRGLFLDRRAFLVSYDPTRDDAAASVLSRLLAATVPIVAGISLEYYFGYVDPTGYGSGTKLPHNVAALLGVMDGTRSDLRTGLPWQMVEIHEPVRLAIVVETRPEALEKALAVNPAVQRLVRNRWVYMAALDPESSLLFEIGAAGFEPHRAESALPLGGRRSRDWYQGKRGHLPIAAIGRASS
jgi:uncharacterized protein YbcC (UPF0753/DUF2309 family)